MRSFPFGSLLPLLVFSLLILRYCHEKPVSIPDPIPVPVPIPQPERLVAPAPTNLPKVDYWSWIPPNTEGEYGGRCRNPREYEFFKAGFHIDGDGKVTTGKKNAKLKTDLQKADYLSMLWMSDGSMSFYLHAKIGDSYLNVTSLPIEVSGASLLQGDSNIDCTRPSTASRLGSSRPGPLVAAMIAAPGPTVVCSPNADTPTLLAYAFKQGVLTLNREVYDLNTVEQEVFLFEKGFTQLFYTAHMSDGRKASLDFDQFGQLTKVEYTGPFGLVQCKTR